MLFLMLIRPFGWNSVEEVNSTAGCENAAAELSAASYNHLVSACVIMGAAHPFRQLTTLNVVHKKMNEHSESNDPTFLHNLSCSGLRPRGDKS